MCFKIISGLRVGFEPTTAGNPTGRLGILARDLNHSNTEDLEYLTVPGAYMQHTYRL